MHKSGRKMHKTERTMRKTDAIVSLLQNKKGTFGAREKHSGRLNRALNDY
jgi:hypothetical protein